MSSSGSSPGDNKDIQINHEELPFTTVFGQMIEDAINELNDIGATYGELDNITEMSFEQTSCNLTDDQRAGGGPGSAGLQSKGTWGEGALSQELVKSIMEQLESEMNASESGMSQTVADELYDTVK